MRSSDEILTPEEAEHFIATCSRGEEKLLLTALLYSLPIDDARSAADKAGYTLEKQ